MILVLFLVLVSIKASPNLQKHSLPLYGNASLGYYYTFLYIGQPAQEQSVIIDTGSQILSIPCTKCQQCSQKHLNKNYNPQISRTNRIITCEKKNKYCQQCKSFNQPSQPCRFSVNYAEGSSLQGIFIADSITLQKTTQGNDQTIKTVFGCTTRQTNLFLKQQANGIFGLAPQRNSTLLEELVASHSIYTTQKFIFSICLASNGGIMNFGRIDQTIHNRKQPNVQVKYNESMNLYSLYNVGNLTFGSTVIHYKGQNSGRYGFFIDSGSTFTYFPKIQYITFERALDNICLQKKQHCQIAKGQQTHCYHLKNLKGTISDFILHTFPPIIMQINDSKIQWKPNHYFLLRDIVNGEICLGIDSLDRFLFGATWMINRDIVFDLDKKSISIYSDSQCSSKKNQMGNYLKNKHGNHPLNYILINNYMRKISLKIILGLVTIVLTIIIIIILCVCKQNSFSKTSNIKFKSLNQFEYVQSEEK